MAEGSWTTFRNKFFMWAVTTAIAGLITLIALLFSKVSTLERANDDDVNELRVQEIVSSHEHPITDDRVGRIIQELERQATVLDNALGDIDKLTRPD